MKYEITLQTVDIFTSDDTSMKFVFLPTTRFSIISDSVDKCYKSIHKSILEHLGKSRSAVQLRILISEENIDRSLIDHLDNEGIE